MILNGKLIIRCSVCGKNNIIDTDNLEDDISRVDEGSMGERYLHSFQEEIMCECCHNSMCFNIFGYEYPIGAMEFQDVSTYGCEIIEAPLMEIEVEPEYDFNVPYDYESWIADNVSELIEQIKDNQSIIYQITDRKFEELVAGIFYRNGYKVEITPEKGDGGKDVIAVKNDGSISICLYIECKHYSPDDPVGVGIVRSVSGVRNHDRVNKAIIVTTSRFTRGARRFAEEEKHLIQLLDVSDLLKMIQG